jgi:PAS domain S-box-containing protein
MSGTLTAKLGSRVLARDVLAFCLFEALFYLAYHYAMHFTQTSASPAWFPDSVLLCALLLTRPANWWLFILGPLPIRLLVDVPPDAQMWFLLSAYAIDSAKGLVVAAALRALVPNPLRLESVRELVIFGLVAVLLVPAAAAFAGAAARHARGFDYWTAWEQWFLGNAFTHMVVTPAILNWFVGARWGRPVQPKRGIEGALLAAGLLGSGYFAFGAAIADGAFATPRLYAPVPFLLWAAIRFGMLGASGTVAVLAAFAVWGTLGGRSPLSALAPVDTGIALQYFVLLGAAPLYLVAMLTDRQESFEQSLRESEQRFRSMADSAPVMIWVTGTDGRCEFVNQGWLAFTGNTLEQERGSRWLDGVHPDDWGHCGEVYDSAFAARRPFEVDYRLRRHDGEHRWVLDRGQPRYSESGAFLGYVGSAMDITDRRRAEEANRDLAHVSRLALVGELTALLAHEVNQPLAAILSNADAAAILLRSDQPPLDEIREIIADIRASDLRADEVIRHIRSLMRKRDIQLQPIDLGETVGDVLRFVAADALERRFRIRREAPAWLPQVLGDRVHLQQVMLNLLVNAMDAMADAPEVMREITVVKTLRGDLVEVAVVDRGHGIPADKLAHVFESFVTTREKGMGVGLSVARSIIESHGGRIWAENNAEGGATFRFTTRVA